MRKFDIAVEKAKVVGLLDLTENDANNIEKAFNINIQCLGQELITTDDLKLVVFKATTMTYANCFHQGQKKMSSNYFSHRIDMEEKQMTIIESGDEMNIDFDDWEDFAECVRNANTEYEKMFKNH